MSLATALLTPLALLLPAAGALEANQDIMGPSCTASQDVALPSPDALEPLKVVPGMSIPQGPQSWPFQFVSRSFEPDITYQVRIEQRVTIRIAPRPTTTSPIRPNMFVGVPSQALAPQIVERKIGRCLPVEGISGVQTNGGNDLLLFMSDRRIVRAELERACRARDFYSGFYLSPSSDGNLCVERDALQSRSGANCKLTRIRQLIQVGN